MNDAPKDIDEALGDYFTADAKTAERDARNVTRALARASDPQAAVARHVWLPWLAAAAMVSFALGVGHAVLFRAPVPSQDLARSLGGDGEGQLAPLTEEEQKQLDGWIKQLSDEQFQVREKAAQQIEAFGPRALPALEKRFDVKDLELSVRAKEIARRIRLEGAWAAAVKLWPAAQKILGVEDPEKRQAGILAVLDGLDKRRVAPALVELAQHLEPGPAMWGTWEALNFLAQPQRIDALGNGAWSGGNPDPVDQTLDRIIPNLMFSENAKTACARTPAKDQYAGKPGRILIPTQVQALGLGFVMVSDGSVKILCADEGAAFWKAWWAKAQNELEWRSADPAKPLPENVAEWLAGLSGSDMRKARTSARYLVDAWDDPAVQDALRALAKGQGEGAARALELLAVAELRNSGVIVFNNKVPGKKMAAWAMNPDGSRRRTLLPAELEAKDWWTLWPGTGNHVLLVDWEKRGLCDYLLEEHMVVPVDAEPVNQVAVRKGTEQIVYMRMHNRDGSPGALHIYDLAAHRHLPVPKVLVGVDIDDLSLSPDGRRISYLRLDPDGAWEGNRSIRVSDLESGEEKKLFGLTGEHQACGDGIEWSADGKYVSCSTYQQKEGRYQKLAYVIEVDSGRHWNLLEGYRGSERLVWSTQGARLAFWAERVAQGAKELVLAAKSDDGWIIRKLDPPEGSETSWLQWTADNRLLVRARDKSWLIDPDNPASAVDVPVADGIYLGDGQVLNGTSGPWFLAEADGVKGCDDRQIVLISRDGKHVVPITNLPCGASGPHFYPNK